jgi:hypothetical protein
VSRVTWHDKWVRGPEWMPLPMLRHGDDGGVRFLLTITTTRTCPLYDLMNDPYDLEPS